MNKEEFGKLFLAELDIAANNAENALGREVPRDYQISLYGCGYSGINLTKEDALDILFLNENSFYLIIDLSVIKVSEQTTTIFTRVSGHKPKNFGSTINFVQGHGPFNQLLAQSIEVD